MTKIVKSEINEAASINQPITNDDTKNVKSPEYKEGDSVTYKTREGGEAVGSIKKIDGKTFTIDNDNIKKEITKKKSDIVGLSKGKQEEMKKESFKTRIASYKQFVKK